MSIVPPVSRDAWSYGGDFHVEASGHNRHRRATIPELKAHFEGSDSSKDRPAHWYEAQLIHYGLPPSKTKGTAKMRLFEAINKGDIKVPAHITKIETDLKKEFAKKEREAKQAIKKQAQQVAPTPAKGSKKRKADQPEIGFAATSVNISLNLSVGSHGNVLISPASPAAKRVKTAKANPVVEKQSKRQPPAKDSGKKTTAAKPAGNSKAASDITPSRAARRGTSSTGSRSISSRPTVDAAPLSSPRTKQTARRGRPFQAGSQVRAPPVTASRKPSHMYGPIAYDEAQDDPPPPYPGSPRYADSGFEQNDNYHDDDQLPLLGLLNGRYEVEGRFGDSRIILTLDGSAVWGDFEIGPLRGVLWLEQRPFGASQNCLGVKWRALDRYGDIHSGDDDGSYLKFLGGGRLKAVIDFNDELLHFDGFRTSGQETRSEINAWTMRSNWDQLA